VGIGLGVWCFQRWAGDRSALKDMAVRIEMLSASLLDALNHQVKLGKAQDDQISDSRHRLDKMEKQLAILPPVRPKHEDSVLKGFR
jgi:hypothetical protein